MKAVNNIFAQVRKVLLIAVAFPFLTATAPAEIISTEQILPSSDRERVRVFMERDEAKARLQTLGVPSETAAQRVEAMTDEEVRVVAARMDTLPAGGALDRTDWVLIILLVILLIVAL